MTQTSARPCSGRSHDRRRQRFARMWTGMDQAVDEQVGVAKNELLNDLPQEVVEIGPGLGSAFPYYGRGTRVTAFEPNEWFHARLREAATEKGIDLTLHGEPFGPGSLEPEGHDCIVTCLTMCSIQDMAEAIAEVHRGLQPDGRLVFIEHVAADAGAQAFYQKVVRTPWRALGDGCDPRSAFLRHLDESPLEVETMRVERLGSNLDPTNLVAWGTAYKR